MAKLQRMTALEAEKLLFSNGFVLVRTKGSHRIYMKRNIRVVIPFHAGDVLHPKIIKQIIYAIEKSNG